MDTFNRAAVQQSVKNAALRSEQVTYAYESIKNAIWNTAASEQCWVQVDLATMFPDIDNLCDIGNKLAMIFTIDGFTVISERSPGVQSKKFKLKISWGI